MGKRKQANIKLRKAFPLLPLLFLCWLRSTHPSYTTLLYLLLHLPPNLNTPELVCHASALPFYIPSSHPWLLPFPYTCPSTYPASPKSTLSPAVILAHFLDHVQTHSSSIHVYTDGSKTQAGLVLPPSYCLTPTITAYPPTPSSVF